MADDLDAWAGDQRAQAAADARSRERWLRQQAAEDAVLAGVLADLVERNAVVVVGLANGRRHTGLLTYVGDNYAALAGDGGQTVLVALEALTSLRPADAAGRSEATGAGRAGHSGRLAHALTDAAAERPRVLLGLLGGETVSGELRSVGADVLTVRSDGEPPGPIYVRLGSICDASLFGSG